MFYVLALIQVRLKTYSKSFMGKEFVKWLVLRKEVENADQGVILGQALLENGVIHHGEWGGREGGGREGKGGREGGGREGRREGGGGREGGREGGGEEGGREGGRGREGVAQTFIGGLPGYKFLVSRPSANQGH